MAEQTLSEKLAGQLLALRLSQIPDAVVSAAKLHILDSLGCLLAGSRLETGKLAYDLAMATSGGGEVEEKFLTLAAPLLGDENARGVPREIEALDERSSLNPLISSLGLPG
jgi:hypothetical protein